MKIHYINILLFALPLNIFVSNQRNHKKTILRTPKTIPTKAHRTLCECELYAPSNYENDPEMKELMENFNHQTSERLREYDERMQDKRKQCKEQCEKDIQKIILKDKIEKELTEKFATLQTNIDTNDIPTCFCEKSIADKTEKVCLNCGKTMGAVAPAWGLVSGFGYAGWSHYVAITVAKAATDAGVKEAIKGLGSIFDLDKLTIVDWTKMITLENFKNPTLLAQVVQKVNIDVCQSGLDENALFCFAEYSMRGKAGKFVQTISQKAAKVAAEAGETAEAAEIVEASKFALNTSILTNTIIASVVAIVIIVLIMVIIYLILRYRRKKKMNKKLQYMKLLK
ncbi:surface antigen [Plasmodium falciparum UGT5.1]|uniref:Surface antigen n=1 Tax=Plasmodium falciparum UGT5.1 TaxID=1237627 RepID=W7JVM6_PLAFA|nr:surface antigen [Plasmodium falciparum UGT5.1]